MKYSEKSHIPIFVDMDGTLVKTDVAQELLLQSLRSFKNIKVILSLAFSGRSHIKRFLAENNKFSAELLPYNLEIIDYLKAEKEKGRKLILATASDELIANQVAAHLGMFDQVLASSPDNNLKGKNKLAAIKGAVFDADFEYIGDSYADYPIWENASYCGFVNPPKSAEKICKKNRNKITLNIDNRELFFKSLMKAMRLHQWAKNTLVFVPLVFSHSYTDIHSIVYSIIAFFIFSLCASGIYLINDLLDLEADRAHKTKKLRPFASGELLPVKGVVASLFLVLLPLLCSALLMELTFTLVIVSYLVLTNLYSFYLKHYSTIDVIALTCLYTIRIIGGGVVIGASLSPWLLNFSLFFFLSLAYMKRYIELSISEKRGKLKGRNYDMDEMDVIMSTGLVNGGLAVLTLTLYLNSNFVTTTYAAPQVLWFISPLMLFWIYRAWMWAKREKIDDDPVVFALKDRISLITVVLAGTVIVFSKYVNIDLF